MTNRMEERLRTLLTRKKSELSEIETQHKQLRREISEFEFVLGGASTESVKTVNKVKKTNRSDTLARWTDEDNEKIIAFVRDNGEIAATKASRELAETLQRSSAAIRSQLKSLVNEGKLKTKRRHGKTAPLIVRAV